MFGAGLATTPFPRMKQVNKHTKSRPRSHVDVMLQTENIQVPSYVAIVHRLSAGGKGWTEDHRPTSRLLARDFRSREKRSNVLQSEV